MRIHIFQFTRFSSNPLIDFLLNAHVQRARVQFRKRDKLRKLEMKAAVATGRTNAELLPCAYSPKRCRYSWRLV